MAYPTTTQSGASPIKQMTISAAIEDLDPLITRADQYAGRLWQLHDRVHGSQPSAVGENATPAPPHSTIDSIQRRRHRLSEILDGMEKAIMGLEGGI